MPPDGMVQSQDIDIVEVFETSSEAERRPKVVEQQEIKGCACLNIQGSLVYHAIVHAGRPAPPPHANSS